ncbi:MAG: hypothetical protein V1859_11020 [archaeon]
MLIKLLRKSWILISILLLLSLIVTLNYFNDGLPIWHFDHFWPILGIKYFLSNLYTWNADGIGMSFVRGIPNLLPMGLFIGIIDFIGLSNLTSQGVYYFFIIASAAVSMYYLCSILNLSKFSRFFSACFYAFGLSLIFGFSYLTLFAFMPLYFGLYINGIKKQKKFPYIYLFSVIWLFTGTSAYSNPGYIIIQWLPLLFAGIFFLFTEKNKQHVIKFSLALAFFWLLINSFWIVPNFFSIKSNLESSEISGMTDITVMKGVSADIKYAMLNLPYGQGYFSKFEKDVIFTWANHFLKNPIVIFIGFLFFLLMILFLVFPNSKDYSFYLFVFFFYLLLIIIENGLKEPFSTINTFVFQKIPFFITIFRNLTKFNLIVMMLAALMIGKSIDTIEKKKLPKAVYAILIVIFIAYSFPVWKGYNFVDKGEFLRSSSVEIPDYYSAADKYLAESNQDARALSMPLTKTYQLALDWDKGYQGSNPYPYLFKKNVIGSKWGSDFLFDTLSGYISRMPLEYLSGDGIFYYQVPYFGFYEERVSSLNGFNGDAEHSPWLADGGQLVCTGNCYLIWDYSFTCPINEVNVSLRSFNHNDYGEKIYLSGDSNEWLLIFNNTLSDNVISVKNISSRYLHGKNRMMMKLESNGRKHSTVSFIDISANLAGTGCKLVRTDEYMYYNYKIDKNGFRKTDIAAFNYLQGNLTSDHNYNNWSIESGQLVSEKPSEIIWKFDVGYPIQNAAFEYRSYNHKDYGERISISRDGLNWIELLNNNADNAGYTQKLAESEYANGANFVYFKLSNNTKKHQTISAIDVSIKYKNDLSKDNIDFKLIKHVLSLYNIDSILFHKDTNWNYIALRSNDWYPNTKFQYLNFLKLFSDDNNNRSVDIGMVSITQLEEEAKYVYFVDSIEKFSKATFANLNIKDAQKYDEEFIISPNAPVENMRIAEYNIANPTEIIVEKKSSMPEYLVLSARYDDNWRLVKGSPSFFDRLGLNDGFNHIKVNFYANAWHIADAGRYTLFFYPQTYLNVFLSLTIIIIIAYPILLISVRKRHR